MIDNMITGAQTFRMVDLFAGAGDRIKEILG